MWDDATLSDQSAVRNVNLYERIFCRLYKVMFWIFTENVDCDQPGLSEITIDSNSDDFKISWWEISIRISITFLLSIICQKIHIKLAFYPDGYPTAGAQTQMLHILY